MNQQDTNDNPNNIIDATEELQEAEQRDAEILEAEKGFMAEESDLDLEILKMKELDPNNPEHQQQIFEKLEQYAKVSGRSRDWTMTLVSFLLDFLPGDAVIGGVLPVGGDIGVSTAMTAYYLERGGESLTKKDIANITARQAADAGIGAVPWVGDVLDWLASHANWKSRGIVKKAQKRHTKELREYLLGAGVSAELLDSIGKDPDEFLAQQRAREQEEQKAA